ncbi:DUF1697 domain-containing protein [Histidinibacterium aquaticum]|nr:DUF1697 domain-containing protein [Histidinibacterium aquaticum]
MAAHVALLRGINVGGANRLPMADLKRIAGGLGWREARSYLASGNLVFEADEGDHEAALREALRREAGLRIAVRVLDAGRFRTIAAACPFSPEDGRLAHVYFCWAEPEIDAGLLERLRAPDERLEAGEGAVYLDAPSGIGRSKLAANLERVVRGTELTGRNLRTVRALDGMLGAA